MKLIYEVNAQKSMSDFPLLSKNKDTKTFQTNLSNFWNKFVRDLSSFGETFEVIEDVIEYLLGFAG